MIVKMLKIKGAQIQASKRSWFFCSTAGSSENPASLQPWRTGFGHPHGSWRRLSRPLLLPNPQVRIHKAVEVPPRPPAEDVDSDTVAEPAEQEELLDSGAAAEQSDWL